MAGDTPLVSVVIPAYNAGRYLGQALESVYAQTHRSIEVVVVDDGSTDDTPALLQKHARVRSIRQTNAGESTARNRAIAETTGEYVALLDADDVCAPNRIAKQVAALEANPEAVGCYTGFWRFDATGVLESCTAAPLPDSVDSLHYLSSCGFLVASLCFRRARATGLQFPEDVRSGPDIVFSALLATRGPYVRVSDPLYGYRSHPAQVSISYRASTCSNAFFEDRYRWAQTHWQEYWPDRQWSDLEARLWQGLAAQTEDAYWARHREFFINDRDYIRAHWPPHIAPPRVRGWRWYPDWLWKLKDLTDRTAATVRRGRAHKELR